MDELTSQERLLLNTQILQFASVNLNTMIQHFQELAKRGGLAEPRLTEMIELYAELNQDLEIVRDKLLNTLDGWDAIGESDLSFLNPMLDALNKSNEQ
jgi:hypothetical protein